MALHFKKPARRSLLLGTVLLVAWYVLLVVAFAQRQELLIQLLALVGTLLWTCPMGLSLGWVFRRHYHIAWIFPAALPVTALILYIAFTSAEILPRGDPLDLHPGHLPGRVHLPIALTVCPFSAAGIALGFLAFPRAYVNPKQMKCIQCAYDIRASIEAGRCPECGRVLLAGVDYPTHGRPPAEGQIAPQESSGPLKNDRETPE